MTKKLKLVIISGSAREKSVTRRVSLYLEKFLASNFEITLVDLYKWNAPIIESVWHEKTQAPEKFQELWQVMNDADCFLMISPEYNGSYSSAMKNLIDHFPKAIYTNKAIGVVTASPGALGGIRAAQNMLLLICGLFAIPQPTFLTVPFVDKKFDESGILLEESFENNVKTFTDNFIWLSTTLRK